MTVGKKKREQSREKACRTRENQLGKLGPATELKGKFGLVQDAVVSACDENGNLAGNRPPIAEGTTPSGRQVVG